MVHYISRALICSLVYFICNEAPVDAHRHARHKASEFDEQYDVVFPRRVNSRGHFLTHYIPTYYQQEVHPPRMGQSRKLVNYIIPMRGEEHHVELRPNTKFMGSDMIIEKHHKDVNRRSMARPNGTQCHYTGFVRGVKDSKVAISTCDGLSGYIRVKRHYFFIEPAGGHQRGQKSAQPHFLRTHANLESMGNKCATWDDVAKVMAKRAGANSKSRAERDGSTLNSCNAELHIETLVVLDKSMLNYHKEIDLENYILTVVNMAHDLFHDASLGVNIDLAIVRLIRLEEEDHEMNMNINKDAEKTLEFFRQWQNKVNPKEDTHPNHHDVAILITRIDICGPDSTCGLLGASKIGGMCDPQNQAAICEDNGLRLGFLIAHEIAHTLAILHDTVEESGCNGTYINNLTTVMDASISIRTAGWSPCSNKFLSLFVESGFGKCLYDPPTEHSFKPVDVLPGVMYDGDFQCRELLGPNAALCMTGIDCENLICYIEDKGCVETHQGVAPGTKCGDKKWCYHGECIEVGEREGAIDGGWGAWSPWSECSRTCGSGVAWQERHCDSPSPANGGRFCFGEKKRHKICSTEPCDAGTPSFRDVQCSEFNSWVYPEDGKVHCWTNFPMHDENPCVLFCINDWGDIASLRPRVVDGTSCQRGMRDICIDGLCKEIPCDLDLESNAVEDVCGVCRGDSTSCDVYKGEISVPCCGRIKEERILNVPKDASNIKVEEMMPTESRIQIRSGNGETVYIVGNVIGSFNVPGTYAWVGNIRTKQEAIAIPGPLAEDISLWLVVTENVTVTYSYGVPAKKKRTACFSWDYLGWTPCSAACGPGVQESIPSCVEKVGGLVDDMFCNQQSACSKPAVQIRACEIAPCINRWFVGDWGACDKCPKGRRTRIVKCIRPTGEGEGEVVFIPDLNCVYPKPKSSEACSCPAPPTKKNEEKKTKKKPKRQVDTSTDQEPGTTIVPYQDEVTNTDDAGKSVTAIQAADGTTYLLTVGTPKVITNSKGEITAIDTGTTISMDTVESRSVQPNPVRITEVCTDPPLTPPSTSKKESVKVTQTTEIVMNFTAPHCPVEMEYDDDQTEECETTTTNANKSNTTFPASALTTCIVVNTTDGSTNAHAVTTTTCATTELETTESTSETFTYARNEKAEMCAKIAALMGKTALDKECIKNLSLTIHTELENGRQPDGFPPAEDPQERGKPSYSITGKNAIKFMSNMQKDFENNKTKIK